MYILRRFHLSLGHALQKILRLAKSKAAKVESAQALVAKASADPKVKEQVKKTKGKGAGRGRGKAAQKNEATNQGNEGNEGNEDTGEKGHHDDDAEVPCDKGEVNSKAAPANKSINLDLKNLWSEKDHLQLFWSLLHLPMIDFEIWSKKN